MHARMTRVLLLLLLLAALLLVPASLLLPQASAAACERSGSGPIVSTGPLGERVGAILHEACLLVAYVVNGECQLLLGRDCI